MQQAVELEISSDRRNYFHFHGTEAGPRNMIWDLSGLMLVDKYVSFFVCCYFVKPFHSCYHYFGAGDQWIQHMSMPRDASVTAPAELSIDPQPKDGIEFGRIHDIRFFLEGSFLKGEHPKRWVFLSVSLPTPPKKGANSMFQSPPKGRVPPPVPWTLRVSVAAKNPETALPQNDAGCKADPKSPSSSPPTGNIMCLFFEGSFFGWFQRKAKRTPSILGGSHNKEHISTSRHSDFFGNPWPPASWGNGKTSSASEGNVQQGAEK